MTNLQPIFDHIDAHFDSYIVRIQEYLRQPGISTSGEGIRESAEMSRSLIEQIGGVEAELVETDGNPVVFGRMYSGMADAKTLIASSLYDLVPANPDEWLSAPFDAHIVDVRSIEVPGIPPDTGDIIIARGAANQRGPSLAFMLALEAIRKATGDLPLNIIFSLDGEEEIASPHWRQFLEAKASVLMEADGAYQHGFRTGDNGRHVLNCGFKGLSLFELTVRGGDWGGSVDGSDLWAADIVWVDSPIQKLVEAIHSLMDTDGRVKVPGFYDNVADLSPEEVELYRRLKEHFDPLSAAKARNVSRFRSYRDPADLFIDLVSGPVLNVDGIVAGYTGSFTTVMPMRANAKLDVRLVPDQSMDDFFRSLRMYLDDSGLHMVEINRIGGTEPGKSSTESTLVSAARAADTEHGALTEVWPISAAANPLGMYARPPFSLPILFAGPGRSGNYHVPNEWCSVEDIRSSMKWIVSFLYAWVAEG